MNDVLRYPLSFDVVVDVLLLCEGDLHGVGGRDLEALERVAGSGGLRLAVKLHERDVVAAGNQADLFEAWGENSRKMVKDGPASIQIWIIRRYPGEAESHYRINA